MKATDVTLTACDFAQTGRIVTFGIIPTRPDTGYGYIKVSENGNATCFVEKPDQATAELMFSSGDYLWNAGIFVISCRTLMKVCQEIEPLMLASAQMAVESSPLTLIFLRLDSEAWNKINASSFDYAIMERSTNIHVLPFPAEWSDLGDWSAFSQHLSQASPPTESGTISIGNVTHINTHNSFLWAEDDATALTSIGVQNIIVVAMADAVLIADLSDAHNVKSIVAELKKKSIPQADQHKRSHRPWGWFESLIKSDGYQVKLLHVEAGAMLSMQRHKHRSEHWVVTSGAATVQIDETHFTLKQNNQPSLLRVSYIDYQMKQKNLYW